MPSNAIIKQFNYEMYDSHVAENNWIALEEILQDINL